MQAPITEIVPMATLLLLEFDVAGDAEMVVAQGKENSERRDLSFIERAFVCSKPGIQRISSISSMAALSVDKTELARLLSVARAIPLATIRAIGPAPKAGRPRWIALAGWLSKAENQRKIDSVLETEEFKALESDRRFERMWSILANTDKQSSRPITGLTRAADALFVSNAA